MPRSSGSADRENAKFAELTLKSLQEAVRRALIDHEQRGLQVPEIDRGEVKWVLPGDKLRLYTTPMPPRMGTGDAEQDADRVELNSEPRDR